MTFVRLRVVAFAIALLPIACEPHRPAEPVPPPAKVWDVSVGTLVRTAPYYAGRQVRVRLPERSYDVAGPTVEFRTARDGRPAEVVFHLVSGLPHDNTRPLTLTGTVAEPVPHAVIRVTGCAIEHPVPPRE